MNAKRLIPLAACLVLAAAAAGARPVAANYEEHCASCHGANGKSQTRLGKKSGSPDLTDKGRAAKITDEEMFKTIKFGRKDRKGEETMEPFAKQLTDAEITELVAYVRRFSR